MKRISFKEVESMVKEIPTNKSLGQDRFTFEFFNAFWHFLGMDIVYLVEESRNLKKIWSTLNAKYITLIQKTNPNSGPSGYHPITL